MRQRSLALRILGYTLVTIALLIAFYALIALFAWQSGEAERARRVQTELRSAVERQYELAATDLAARNYDLAEQRVNYLATLSPQDARLAPLQATLASALNQPAAGFAPTATAAPTATPRAETIEPAESAALDDQAAVEPTVTPIVTLSSDDPAVALADIEATLAAEAWEVAIRDLLAFQLVYPGYERYTTDTLLQEAYIGAGFYYTSRDRVALGVNYFEQAQALGPIPESSLAQLNFSRAYLNALAFYGVNWSIAIANLEQICPYAPLFQDSCELLVQARLAYGNQLYTAGQYCPAESQFSAARRVANTAEINSRLADARTACANATPTPFPTSELFTTPSLFGTPNPFVTPDPFATVEPAATPEPPVTPAATATSDD